MKRWIVVGSLFLVTTLFLVGCQAESEPEVAVIPTLADEPAASPPGPTATTAAPRPAPTDLPQPNLAAVPSAEPTVPPSEESVVQPPTAEVIDPDPVGDVGFGMVEGTFYRGSPDAPVRMIDYSDFL